MRCKYCNHAKTHKRGKAQRGTEKYQRYICDRCQKSFSELSGTIYENRHLTPTDIDRVLEHRSAGMNFTEIARTLGVSRHTVSNLIKDRERGFANSTDGSQSIETKTDIDRD